jgi:RHS repeat-associated protein
MRARLGGGYRNYVYNGDPSASLRAGLDAWGQQLASGGSTPNPYRFGATWGYITDPSGMLQLGARFYWPEVGRFISQHPGVAPERARLASRSPG